MIIETDKNIFINLSENNRIFERDVDILKVNNSLLNRINPKIRKYASTGRYGISSYIFIEGVVPIRWNRQLDKYRVSDLFYPHHNLIHFLMNYPVYFSGEFPIWAEVPISGIYELVKPKFNKRNLILKPTDFSYVFSEVERKYINVKKIGKIYVDKNDLVRHELTGELLPECTLPLMPDGFGNFKTNINYSFISYKDYAMVIKNLFPDKFEDILIKIKNKEPQKKYKKGILVNEDNTGCIKRASSKELKEEKETLFINTITALSEILINFKHSKYTEESVVLQKLSKRCGLKDFAIEGVETLNEHIRLMTEHLQHSSEIAYEITIEKAFEEILRLKPEGKKHDTYIYRDLDKIYQRTGNKGYGLSALSKLLPKYRKKN